MTQPSRFALCTEAVRSAGRALARRPRFSVGTIALLGGTLAAFALVVALLAAVVVRPLPFPAPDPLVAVYATVHRETTERRGFSVADFRDYQATARSFEALAAYIAFDVTMRGVGGPRVTSAELVDHRYLDVLRTAPVMGRAFVANGNEAVALVSDVLWRDRFGADAGVLGRAVSIDGQGYTIIGVMPAGFHGVTGDADVWIPFDAPGLLEADTLTYRGERWHEAIGRLAPDATLEDANRELADIGARLEAEYPDSNRDRAAAAQPLRAELLGTQDAAVRAATLGVALLLAITVLNLGGLALVRSTARAMEHAMRRCLGATPGRLLLGSAAEGALVGAGAALVGLVLTAAILPWLPRVLPMQLPPFVVPTLGAGVALTVAATGVLSGVAAFVLGALAARDRGTVSLRAGARSTRSHAAVRKALVGAEVALGIALLGGALLLARSFAALDALDPGYRVAHSAVVDIELPTDRYDEATALAFAERLRRELAASPGVRAAALASDTPLGDDSSATMVTSDQLEAESARTYRHNVSPEFFDAAGVPLVAGETFPVNLAPDGERLAIVSAKFARRTWGTTDALGRKVKFGRSDSTEPWMRVVGVSADFRWRGLPAGPTDDADIFVPVVQAPETAYSLLLDVADEPLALTRRVGQALRGLDPEIPVYAAQTMTQRVRQQTGIPRFLATLGMGFAAVALLLSALGIYAISALESSQRVRELAIRQAVGASARSLVGLFAGEYGRIFAVALALGAVAIVPIGRLLEDRLYGVSTADPWSLLGSAALFALAMGVGLLAPLRQVVAVDPAQLMRSE